MKEALDTKTQANREVKFRKTSSNLTGQRFGRLLVLEFSHVGKHYSKYWNCICDCGVRKKIASPYLISNRTKSCGCWLRDFPSTLSHGQCRRQNKTSEYRAWMGMKSRALNPKSEHFDRYGGRGIKICSRWLDSFENFFEDMGNKPSASHSIHRIDNDGDYTPENCCWATKKEQARHRCSSRLIEHNGATKTLAEWAENAGMDIRSLWQRIKRGWSFDESINDPLTRRKKYKI